MEANGKFDFAATAEDELSFRKGELLKILGTNDDWFKAELHGQEGFVPRNYIDIQLPSWYQESASRGDAQESLMTQPVGAFLIRGSRSQSTPGQFSISVRHELDVQHFKVMRDSRGQYNLWTEKFPSLNRLVDFYKQNSVSKQSTVFLLESGQQSSLQVRGTSQNKPPATASHHPPDPTPQPRDPTPQPRDPTPQPRDPTPQPRDPTPQPRDLTPQPRQRPAMAADQVRALYNFTAEEKDELNFSVGDVIEVVERSDAASWWTGRLRGQIGLFPSNYTTPA